MVVFDPELAARMKMPKEMLEKAPELHFTMHISKQHIHAALYDFSIASCLWNVHSEIPVGLSPFKFIYQRNWIEGVFRRCSVTFDSDTYALVPTPLFDENSCNDYLHMQHGLQQTQTAFIELTEVDAVICYELPEWYAELIRCFPNARILPLSALLARTAVAKMNQAKAEMVVAFSSSSVTIAAVKSKALVLLTTHEARTHEDVLYQISNAAMRLQIDLDDCSIELLDATDSTELLLLLKQYVKEAKSFAFPVSTNGSAITQLHYLCA
jgi:hypothetical protein